MTRLQTCTLTHRHLSTLTSWGGSDSFANRGNKGEHTDAVTRCVCRSVRLWNWNQSLYDTHTHIHTPSPNVTLSFWPKVPAMTSSSLGVVPLISSWQDREAVFLGGRRVLLGMEQLCHASQHSAPQQEAPFSSSLGPQIYLRLKPQLLLTRLQASEFLCDSLPLAFRLSFTAQQSVFRRQASQQQNSHEAQSSFLTKASAHAVSTSAQLSVRLNQMSTYVTLQGLSQTVTMKN